MRRFVLSLVILVGAGFAAYAQKDPGTLEGVYGAPLSAPGKLRGVYEFPAVGSPRASLVELSLRQTMLRSAARPFRSLAEPPWVRRCRKASTRLQSLAGLAMAVRRSMGVPP